MASSAEVMQPLPDTLPDDFSEWDSGYSAAAQSVNFNVSAASVEDRSATRPPSHSANPRYTAVAVSDGSNVLPRFTAGSFDAADEFLLRSFRLKEAREIRPKRTTKTRTIVAIVAVPSILLSLAIVAVLYPGSRSRLARVKHSIPNLSTSADKDLAGNMPKPSASELLTGAAQSSTLAANELPSAKSAAGADPATHELEQVPSPQVESKMMTDQLTAPTQIPHEIKAVAPEEAPPASGFGAAGGEGLDSSGANLVRSVLNAGNNGPTVSPELVKPDLAKVTISSGVAAGMLLHGTKPQYPAIAKSAHVSGTVVLHATISKWGTIENLRVDSGQAMLSQAAMDAVSTWRYRPYLLNGEPVDIDTTISVVFTNPSE
jgi:TonB family protein